jgi:signal transduction histidine kinase
VIDDLLKLKELEVRREEWASIVAHDLQQPINAILMRTDVLLRMGIGDELLENVRHIRTAAQHLGRMTSDLLDASQLETCRMRVVLRRVDLVALVNETLQRMVDAASRTVVVAPRDERPIVLGDAQRLEQVVANLVSNAVKYGTPDTTIRIEITARDHDAEVCVVNDGPGIASDELGKIFDRYVRSPKAGSAKGRSLGLGLYIARGLVEAHGGRIWGESLPGDTTTFHFTVPLESSRRRRPALRAMTDDSLAESVEFS